MTLRQAAETLIIARPHIARLLAEHARGDRERLDIPALALQLSQQARCRRQGTEEACDAWRYAPQAEQLEAVTQIVTEGRTAEVAA